MAGMRIILISVLLGFLGAVECFAGDCNKAKITTVCMQEKQDDAGYTLACEELADALGAKGYTVSQKHCKIGPDTSGLPAGDLVLAGNYKHVDVPAWQPEKKEAYRIKPISMKGRNAVLVEGDDSGLMYGLFRLAECVRLGEDLWQIDIESAPAFKLRIFSEEGQLLDIPDRGYYTDEPPYVNEQILQDEVDEAKQMIRHIVKLGYNSVSFLNLGVEEYIDYRYLDKEIYPQDDKHRLRSPVFCRYLSQLCDYAHSLGVDVYLQLYEIQYPPKLDELYTVDMNSPNIERIINARYRELFERVPLDGVIITTTETHPRVGYKSKMLWRDKGRAGAGKMMTMYHNACKAMGKKCIFRMWRVAQQADDVKEVIENVPDDAVLAIKNTGSDYFLHMPITTAITEGIAHKQPMVVLFDTFRSYHGWARLFCYMKRWGKRVRACRDNGVIGIDGWGPWSLGCNCPDYEPGFLRGDVNGVSWRGHWNMFRMFTRGFTPGQANVYLLAKLAWDPDVDVEKITEDFAALHLGRENACAAAEALLATQEAFKAEYVEGTHPTYMKWAMLFAPREEFMERAYANKSLDEVLSSNRFALRQVVKMEQAFARTNPAKAPDGERYEQFKQGIEKTALFLRTFYKWRQCWWRWRTDRELTGEGKEANAAALRMAKAELLSLFEQWQKFPQEARFWRITLRYGQPNLPCDDAFPYFLPTSDITMETTMHNLVVEPRANTGASKAYEVDWVDPFINTMGDNGQMYPGAVCPFGLVKLSPDTDGLPHSGYYYDKKEIHGFSHLRVGGTGCDGAGGNVLIKPGIGDLNDFEQHHKKFYKKSAIRYSPFYKEAYDKSSERASPGYYKVEFKSGIKAELTASTRVGFHRYTFPASERSFILVDLSRTYEIYGMLDASLQVESSNEICGMFKSRNVCGWGDPKVRDQNPHYKMYYAIKFDKEFDSFKTWKDADIESGVRNRRGPNIGVWVNFSTSQGEVIQAKVGISAITIEQAKFERDNEIEGWDFDKAKNDARCAWQKMLGKVEIPEGRPDLKTIFYTKLYHSYLMPSNVTSSLGTYRAARDEDTLRFTSDTAEDYVYYCGWSLWDDFRKYMLISLTEPDIMQNIARSLVDYYKTRGEYVFWSTGYWPCPSVRQEFTSAVIADAYQKGLADFDVNAAFEGMKTDVDNFKANNVGTKLEKAYQAYLVMKMAGLLSRKDDYEKYRVQALSYKDHWNPKQKDDQGNVRGFFTLNKKAVDSVEKWGCCYEGNSWHYRWFVFHDMKGFVNLRGSRELLADDLDYFFKQDLYMHLNEPDMHVPFLFNYLGRPDLTGKWTRAFTTKVVTQRFHNHGPYKQPVIRRIYRADPQGYIRTMDDDVGAMSSWFVYSAIGLFPGVPGDPYYLIGSPIFPEVRLHLKGGKVFTIKANNVCEDNFYIQSTKLNGRRYNKPWIEYSTIMAGGKLELEMGPKPNESWGSEPADAPPSLSR